jgi:hypothetical protein
MAVSLQQIFRRGGSSNGLNGGTIGILRFQRKTGVSPLHVTIAGRLVSLALENTVKMACFWSVWRQPLQPWRNLFSSRNYNEFFDV